MFKEFKEFALRGNVLDLAVAVVLGAAFGKIVTSFVNDIVMPIIGMLMGGINFVDLKYVITPASGDLAESAILYGQFIQSIVDFIIIALAIFFFIRLLVSKKKEEPVEESPAEPSTEELLLSEIRDIIKEK